MTGMERLLAAINGTPADRIPVFCNLLDQGAAELGMSLEDYYASGERVAEAQLKMRARFGYDNVWSLFYVGKEAELMGCSAIIYAADGPPNVGEMIVRTYDDIDKLTVPDDITAHPAFAEEMKCLRILRDEVGGKYPICAYVTASMTMPALLMGMEKWMHLLMMGPPDVRDRLLAKCADLCRKRLAAYHEAGVDIVVYSNPFGSTDFIPLKFFHELSVPWMERDLASASSAGIVYYCGSARFGAIIDTILDKLALPAFYLSPHDDIAACKKVIADRALTCGIINDIMLRTWSRDEIRAEVKRIIDAGMPGGHFLFGTLVMPCSIPEESICTMLDAAYEFGRIATP
jgi:uroporphyrinogen decarboxylase